MDYTSYLVPLGTPGSILVSSLKPPGLACLHTLDHVRELDLPTPVTRQKNTDVIYFQTGVVDPELLQHQDDVWMVAVMPDDTLVFNQADNNEYDSARPVTPPITLRQHRASLREMLPGLIIGTPLFPEIRVPVNRIPRDARYVQVNPVLDKHEYLNPWWIVNDQKYDAPRQFDCGGCKVLYMWDCTRSKHKVKYVYVVKWTRTEGWYQYDRNSGKYRVMTLNDKVRAASSGGKAPYYIENVLLRRLIADIAFA